MIIKIHNDGKGKHQSFEAWIEDFDIERGYGETESQAISEYHKNVIEASNKLTDLLSLPWSGFKREKVDWKGEPI